MYIYANDAAKILNVSKPTIERWVKNGKLGALQLPGGGHRILEASVNELLRKEFQFLEAKPQLSLLDQLNEASLAYIAGLFDGEGSVTITRRKQWNYFFLTITITNTNKDVISKLQELLGGSVHHKIYKNPKYKQGWYWQANTKRAGLILEKLLPYLIIKRGKAEIAIQFQNHIRKGFKQGTDGRAVALSEDEIKERLEFKGRLEDAC